MASPISTRQLRLVPGIIFGECEPMKRGTLVFADRWNYLSGVASCSIRPAFITIIWSAMVMTSTGSSVT